MAADSSKINTNDLIAKIKLQQENINKQSNISIIDIDLQLDYIRTLYESYIVLRGETIALREKNEKKTNLSECGTLSLFDDVEEQEPDTIIKKSTIQEDENSSPIESIVNISEFDTEIESEPEPEIEQTTFDDVEEQDAIIEKSIIQENENPSPIESIVNISEFDTEIESEPEPEIEKELKAETDIEIESEIELELEEESVISEMDEKEFEEPIESISDVEIELDIMETNSFVSGEQTDMLEEEEEDDNDNSIKNEQQSIAEIDLDSIEFAEDEEPDDDTDNKMKITSTVHTGIPSGRPTYWGDELDIEEPVVAKPASVGDKYITNKPSLNEIVSGFKPDESIGMKLQHGSVSDLMKSIDMNNKFLFVKELFKGNGSAFTEEINNLNNHSKLDSALKYLDKIKEKYDWNETSEAYRELNRLILRKYAK